MEKRSVFDNKILIVDDNLELRKLLRLFLTKEGYTKIETAADCRSAEQCIMEGQPDFIILDVNLPDGDGFSLMKRIRENQISREIPVLFLSARDQDQDRLRGLGLGADDYMVKPFLPKELLLRMGAILKRSYSYERGSASVAGGMDGRKGTRDSLSGSVSGGMRQNDACDAGIAYKGGMGDRSRIMCRGGAGDGSETKAAGKRGYGSDSGFASSSGLDSGLGFGLDASSDASLDSGFSAGFGSDLDFSFSAVGAVDRVSTGTEKKENGTEKEIEVAIETEHQDSFVYELETQRKAGVRSEMSYMGAAAHHLLSLGSHLIDFDAATVTCGGETDKLTVKELKILETLEESRGKIVTFDNLCAAVWNAKYYTYENTVMVHMRRLREKVEDDPSHPKWIVTARGIGYKMNLKPAEPKKK